MSRVWRQTIGDELAALVDAQRGALTLQEYTTFALASATQQPTVAELQRELAELRAQVARLGAVPQLLDVSARATSTPEMLSF